MKRFRFLRLIALVAAAVCITGFVRGAVHAGELNVEAQLIWGTNDPSSPNPKHKAVEPAISKKLSKTPLKWKNYFEEERKTVSIPQGTPKKLKMSESCELELNNLGGDKIEAKLYGKGKQVIRRVGSLADNEILIIGGDAENDTAWLITLRKTGGKK